MLNNWWQIQHGVGLAQIVSEPDFIALINDMVASGEIMQIKQRFSMPYTFGSVLQILSQNGSTTTSNRSLLVDYNIRSPDAPKPQSESGIRLSRTQSEQLPPSGSTLQIDK